MNHNIRICQHLCEEVLATTNIAAVHAMYVTINSHNSMSRYVCIRMYWIEIEIGEMMQ